MKKTDLVYKNSGRAAAHKIQQTAFSISRSHVRDNMPGNIPPLMSEEGKKLAKNSAPRNAFEIPYLDDSRTKMSLGDDEADAWRRFKPGDQTPWDDPAVEDPDNKLFGLNTDGEPEEPGEEEPEEEEEEEPEEEEPEEEEEEEEEENEELSRTQGAFDRQRLFRAIDRLTKRSMRRRVASRDGRSYGRDGRNYSVCSGFIGGVQEWNSAYRRGEVC